MASLAPTPDAEYRELCGCAALKANRLQADSDGLDGEIERRLEDNARQLYQRILRECDEIPCRINAAAGSAASASPGARSNPAPAFSEAYVRQALRDAGAVRAQQTVRINSPVARSAIATVILRSP